MGPTGAVGAPGSRGGPGDIGPEVRNEIYIYIYAFSRRFYPKRLTVYSDYTCFCQYVCSLGIEPTTFCAADAMFHH